MTGEIIKIHDPVKSTHGNSFIRVEFKMSDGGWAHTYLCRDYRNYQFWRKYLKTGKILTKLKMKGNIIDADSRPVEVRPAGPTKRELGEIYQLKGEDRERYFHRLGCL